MSLKNSSVLSLKTFFIQLSLVSALAFGTLYLWQQYTSLRFQANLGFFIVLFFILMSAFIHIVLVRAAEQSPKKFIMYFMTITGLRLFGYLIIIMIYAVLKREAALGFTLLFLLMYFLFSAFEVIALLKLFKK